MENDQNVVYWTVYGYLTPTGEKTFSSEDEAMHSAHLLAQNDWVSQVTVVKKEVVWTYVQQKSVLNVPAEMGSAYERNPYTH